MAKRLPPGPPGSTGIGGATNRPFAWIGPAVKTEACATVSGMWFAGSCTMMDIVGSGPWFDAWLYNVGGPDFQPGRPPEGER